MSDEIGAGVGDRGPRRGFRDLSLSDKLAYLREHGEPADRREGIDTVSLRERFPRLAAVETVDLVLRGADGDLPMRSYSARQAAPAGRGLVWAHGGAFIGGHLDMPEANWVALELAASGIPVLSIDYRKCLGDTHFPTPADDVDRAWSFAQEHSVSLWGVHPERLVLGGASAGATLAASMVKRRIDRGSPVPSGLVLVYPALHPDPTAPEGEVESGGVFLELSRNYAGSAEALADPQAFPGLGGGGGYPPTLIIGCERDRFLPSAEAFARGLRRAGVATRFRVERDADHGHIDEPSSAAAHRTIEAMRTWISASPIAVR